MVYMDCIHGLSREFLSRFRWHFVYTTYLLHADYNVLFLCTLTVMKGTFAQRQL
jgi:hypothetical protein